MSADLFRASGETLAGNKSLRFPVRMTVMRPDFQSALTAAWVVVQRIGEQAGEWQSGHGKLVFLPVMADASVLTGMGCRFFQEGGVAGLELELSLELVFGFQAGVWERLEAVAGVMDFLVGLENRVKDEGIVVLAEISTLENQNGTLPYQ